MNLKPSYYNHMATLENGKTILFNFFTECLFEVKEDEIDQVNYILENCDVEMEGKANELKQRLIDQWYLIPDETDELQMIRIRNLSKRYESLSYDLVVMPTLDCNFSCKYCYETHKNVYMSPEVKMGVINWAKKISKVARRLSISWFGGEPMLDFSLIDEINSNIKKICTENRCFFISDITTNGSLFTEDILSKIDELNIFNFQITIDGPPEFHNTYRPFMDGTESFDLVFSNIFRILNHTRAKVSLRINIDMDNYREIPRLLDMIPKEYRTPRLMIVFKDIFSDPAGNLGIEEKINEKRIKSYQYMKNLYHYAIEQGFNVFLPALRIQDHHCESGSKNHFIIHPTGDLYKCTVAYETGKRAGKLRKDGTLQIDSVETSKWLAYIPGDDQRCAECKFLPRCQGGCRYNRIMGKNPCLLESTDLDEMINLYYLSKVAFSG